jgi:hypothetical protein
MTEKKTTGIHVLNDQPKPETGNFLAQSDLALSHDIPLLVSEGPLFESGYANKFFPHFIYTGVPSYLRVIRSKTNRGYVKQRIIQNVIHNMIFV